MRTFLSVAVLLVGCHWARAQSPAQATETYTAKGRTFTYAADYSRLSVTLKPAAGLRSAAVARLRSGAQLRKLAQPVSLEATEVQFSSRDESRRLYVDVNTPAGAMTPELGQAAVKALLQDPAVAAVHPSYTLNGERVYLTGTVLVSVDGRHATLPASLQAEVDAKGGQVTQVFDMRRRTVFAISYPAQLSLFDQTRALNGRNDLAYAVPDFEFTAYSPRAVELATAEQLPPAAPAAALTTNPPNDDWYSLQAFLDNPFDTDIDGPEAWAVTQGSTNVHVVVMDVGFDITHEDIASRISTTFSYDAVTGSNFPTPENANANHGTPCMGLVGAISNNFTGVASVGYNVRPFPLNFGSNPTAMGSFSSSSTIIIAGATYVINNGANVVAVSCSFTLNSTGNDPLVEDAFDDMRTQCRNGKGAVILASTGNNGADRVGTAMGAPARYPHVIGVAASDYLDQLASFSNFGDSVDVAAPGTRNYGPDAMSPPYVYTLDRTGMAGYNSSTNPNSYDRFSGTSASCPIAAGVVGLIASVNPNLTEGRLRRILCQSADKVTLPYLDTRDFGTWNRFLGYGRVNAHQAVLAANVTLSTEEQEGSLSSQLRIAPNPVSDVLVLTGEVPGAGRLRTVLTDASGRPVRRADQDASGAVEVRMGVSDLAPGVYLFNASYGEARGQWKVVKR